MNDQTFVFGKEGTLGENAFVNVGYDFGGWTWKGQSYGGTFTVTADNLPESGTVITLTAVWTEKTYTIVYEEKGGESVSDAENVAFLENVPLPTATRTGYAFLGWATSDGGNVVYAGGAQVPVNLLFTGLEGTGARQKTLYAKWEAIEYTISYVLNGGTNGANPATYTVETETIALNAPNRTGYTPLGWYDKEEGGNEVTEIAKGSTGNITLYAVWEAEEYPVTVNAGEGGSFSELPEGAVGTEGTEGSWTQFKIWLKYGTDVTAMLASLEVNVAAYHHLSDWNSTGDLEFLTGALTVTAQYTATEGAIVVTVLHADGTVYTINATYGEPLSESEAFTHASTGYTYNGWYYLDGEKKTFVFDKTIITRPITIYPNATADKYDVTTSASNVDFVGGGDKVAAYGQSYTVTYLPALGYELSDLTVTMSGQQLAEGDYSYDAATGRLTIDRITGAIAISATVTAKKYTVTFDPNGGQLKDDETVPVTFGTAIASPDDPTQEGYTFDGWTYNGTAWNFESGTMPASDITLVASWQINVYKVTFIADGAKSETQYLHGAKVTRPVDPVKDGYTFLGWYAKGSETAYDFAAALTGDLTLTAKWEAIEYTISYVLNGGTNGANPATYTVETETIVLNAPNRMGYTFAGWFDADENGNRIEQIAKGKTGNITLYARWTANSYTVVFNANGGDNAMGGLTLTYDVAEQLTECTLIRNGYTFAGWATSENGAVAYLDGATVINLASKDGAEVTLYAVWTPNTYTVTFDGNEGSIQGSGSKQVTFGSAYGALPTATRTGYTFLGWFTAQTGGTQVKDVTVVNTASEHTLYAQWKAIEYTITYHDTDGSGATQTQTFTYADENFASAELQSFTRTGYTFTGWATSEGGYAAYADKARLSMLALPTDGTEISLYAKWAINRYTVTVELTMPDSTDEATIASVRGYVANALSKWNVTIAQSETSLTVTVADLPYGTSLGDLNELFRTEENYSQITVDGALYLFVWTAAPDGTLGAGNAKYEGGWDNENVRQVTVSVDGEAPYKKTYYVTEKDGSYTFDLGTLATPEKRGCVFGGWQVTGGTLADNILTITSDSAQVTPTWKQITYTVTYGGEEVSLGDLDLVFTWDGSQFTPKEGDVAELADVTRVGYTFAGWKYGELTVKTLEALFAGSELGNAGGTEENVTIELTAVWAANEYTRRVR